MLDSGLSLKYDWQKPFSTWSPSFLKCYLHPHCVRESIPFKICLCPLSSAQILKKKLLFLLEPLKNNISSLRERDIPPCCLVIRGMQIKTALRFHLTWVRMAKIKNTGDSRCWRGCGEREILLHCWWDCKLVQPLWKSVWRFLRKLDIVPPEDPAISLLGI